MHRKYVLILALLVVVPLLAFYLLGRQLVEAEQVRTRQQFAAILTSNLASIDSTIGDYFEDTQQRLIGADIDTHKVDSIRQFVRSEPIVEQVILLDKNGIPLYPQPNDPYLQKISQLIVDRTFVQRSATQLAAAQQNIATHAASQSTITKLAPLGDQPVELIIHPPNSDSTSIKLPRGENDGNYMGNTGYIGSQDFGWYGWYWGNGLQLVHWQKLEDNRTLVVGLKRARWMADIIGVLPDSNPNSVDRTAPSQIRLLDMDGDLVYLWGANKDVAVDAEPATQLRLSAPLGPWQLQHFGPAKPLSLGKSATMINLLGAGGLLFAGLLGLVVFLSREIGRQTREARQRVSFVNQVSHELKTPLTNIRMYADLLEHDLERIDPDDEKARSHVSVITSESGRLSRLINNVLTLARMNRDAPQATIQPGCVDDVIETVIEQFRPSLDMLGIEVVLNLDAPQRVSLDADTLEQMLGNLISNVEKYAADGKHLRIASHYKNGKTTIDVSDAGPGISHSFAKRVFEPFERASDHIASAAGTGIGLGITRSLARRTGGDLVLRETSIGASFRLTLATPICES